MSDKSYIAGKANSFSITLQHKFYYQEGGAIMIKE